MFYNYKLPLILFLQERCCCILAFAPPKTMYDWFIEMQPGQRLSPDFHDNGFRQTILHGGAKMMCGDVSVCLYDTILVCSPDHFVDQCRFQKDWEGTTHCSYCGGCHPCVSEATILNPPSTNMMPFFVCELYIIRYLYICTFQWVREKSPDPALIYTVYTSCLSSNDPDQCVSVSGGQCIGFKPYTSRMPIT